MRSIECHPNPENATEAELRVAMDAAPNRRSSIRLNAIRVLLLGYDRKSVCEIFARSDRMVRLWIHAFNQSGIEGLISKPRTGRPRKVKMQKVKDLLIPVLEDPSQAGEFHWTGVKIHGYLTEKLSIELGYRTTIRWLHEMDFNLRVPQPWPVGQKEEDRQVFKEKIQQWSNDPNVELWFCDESGIEGDPRPRRRWVQPGKTRTSPYLGKHIRQNVIGSVAPQSGAFFSLIVNGVDKEVFQFYLDQMAEAIPKKKGKRQLLIMDNASWHKAKSLDWHHFEPVYLPAYSPDFNPIERLWLRLKADWFYDFLAKTTEELTDRISTALMSFVQSPEKTASICSIRK